MDDQHLALRRQHVCSTDAPAILGLSRFKSAIDVFAEKVGLGEAVEMSERMRWGLRLEQALADAYQEESGRPSEIPAQPFIARDDLGYPAGCSPDRMTVVDGAKAVLELKTTSVYVEDADDLPEEWMVQVGHQMLVLDVPVAVLAVLSMSRGPSFKWFDLERRTGFEQHLVDREGSFWHDHVLTGVAPEPDGSEASLRAIHRLHPSEIPGNVVELPGELIPLVDAWEAAQAQMRESERIVDDARARVMMAMGPSEIGIMPDGRRFTFKTQAGATYTVTREPKRVLRRAKAEGSRGR